MTSDTRKYLFDLSKVYTWKAVKVHDQSYRFQRIVCPLGNATPYFKVFTKQYGSRNTPWIFIDKLIHENELMLRDETFLKILEPEHRNVLDYIHYDLKNHICRVYFNFVYRDHFLKTAVDEDFITEMIPLMKNYEVKHKGHYIEIDQKHKIITNTDMVFVLEYSPINLIKPQLYYGLKCDIEFTGQLKTFDVTLHNPFLLHDFRLRDAELDDPVFYMNGLVRKHMDDMYKKVIKKLLSIPIFPDWSVSFRGKKIERFVIAFDFLYNRISDKYKNVYYATWIWSWLLRCMKGDRIVDEANILTREYVANLLKNNSINYDTQKQIFNITKTEGN